MNSSIFDRVFILVHFPQNPNLTAKDMTDIQFHSSSTTIKTADITYEGQRTKSSELCGILGFVDDQGHIHLSSNFDLYTMRPKLADFSLNLTKDSNNELTKLDVSENQICSSNLQSMFREVISMKNSVLNKNVVLYIHKNAIPLRVLF